MKIMLVTINTDASYNHKFKLGAYAFWIVCDRGRFQHSGVLKNQISRPEEAEFQCIINGLHVLGLLRLADVSKVIINTDCLNVIHLITNDVKSIEQYGLRKWGTPLLRAYRSTINKAKLKGIAIELRHVKAHTSTDTKREWVNQWCDEMAKKSLALALKAKN